jgi:hypothetical protein
MKITVQDFDGANTVHPYFGPAMKGEQILHVRYERVLDPFRGYLAHTSAGWIEADRLTVMAS